MLRTIHFMPAYHELAWIACVIYATIPCFWITAHSLVARWRRSRSTYRSLLLLWMGYIATLMALTIRLRHLMAYTMSPIAWFLALICWTAGGLIYVRISEFGVPRFTGKDEMQGRGELIATGMHGEVRHPIYLGHLLMQLGWAVSSGSAAGFICVAVALATGAVMLQMEERELMQRFGDDYREYRKQVPMIIPRSAKIFRLPTDRNS